MWQYYILISSGYSNYVARDVRGHALSRHG